MTTTAVTSPAPIATDADRRMLLTRTAVVALATVLWFVPAPDGLALPAWRLFIVFAAAIASVVVNAFPILTASVLAVAASVLTGLLPPAKAYAGFANGTILLIVLAFLVARAVVKCGLGARIGYLVVSVFGRSTLGLSYSIFLVDGLIAPAFPSNTARSGVIYPLAFSLAEAAGARRDDDGCRRVGSFLMFSGIASLGLSSALWLTAMAANPLGAEIARTFGVNITFGGWLIAACVPTLVAMALMPPLLHWLIAPERTATPDAPAAARRALESLGPLTPAEWIVLGAFVGMVALWASAATFALDSTAVAFLGLGVLLAAGVLTLDDIAKEGDVLATFIWFAVLFTLSSQLNELGFMGFLGQKIAASLGGLPAIAAGLVLVAAYVLLHYVFVSQTAHSLALLGVFLDVGVKLGVPAAPLAFQLLFATNYFSSITPQGSSANLLFAGSGFLSQRDLYRLGGLTTASCMLVYLIVGLPWLRLVVG
ncbi:MAG TPA: DASS family sodium-coupled anion symporter [Vicinamibacterales bacterium]|nr:DASS family sodium-coupled anion symporter [Vicinamibacterales bacterium]